jgi:hypothetical protein
MVAAGTAKGKIMHNTRTLTIWVSSTVVAVAVALSLPTPARSADAGIAAAYDRSLPQKSFATPEQAFVQLTAALQAGDQKTLAAILGTRGTALLHSGDPVEDRRSAENFLTAYAAKHSVMRDGPGRATLAIGDDSWIMPIPAIQGAHGWSLDASAGAKEILARRIGQNELSAIEVARAMRNANMPAKVTMPAAPVNMPRVSIAARDGTTGCTGRLRRGNPSARWARSLRRRRARGTARQARASLITGITSGC